MVRPRRKNEKLLTVLRACTIAVLTAIGLAGMAAKPEWLPFAVAILAGGLALVSTELAVLIAVVALCVPVIAAQPVIGFAVLIILVASVRYLGADGARGFLILGVSLLGAFAGPVWAGVALAGYLFGAGEGALAAALACLVIEASGIALGRSVIGATITGGSPTAVAGHPAHAILTFAHAPATLLSADWLAHSFSVLNTKYVTQTMDGIAKISQPVALVLQPCLWALGAGVAGAIGKTARRTRNLPMSVAAVCAGVAVPALGSAAFALALRIPISWSSIALAFATSCLLAGVFVVVWVRAFPPVKAPAKASARRGASMATEDADVDELLQLIATAEDKLTSQHTSIRTVMITDMKSFSRMTEEDGSVATAKAIQRHRDLLLPIIQSHRGSGKSTGGDGLVAAFESAEDALHAATAMQRALVANAAAHPDEREIWVRIGLASGEVVLDKGGRPFIGAGLNLAARVMNLADGGQVFATAGVATACKADDVRTYSFGDFELKNIAKPVEIVELLWDPAQEPKDPRDTGAAIVDEEAQ